MNQIYLDNAAATAVDEEILKKYIGYTQEFWANPSSYHSLGRSAKNKLEEARIRIAAMIGAEAGEVFFVPSSTIANNIVLNSFKKIISFDFEHPSIEKVIRKNNQITLKVGEGGVVEPQKVIEAINDQTDLISLMMVNNILGTIQPIKEISHLLSGINQERQSHGLPLIRLHSDCSQGYKYLKCNVKELGLDMMTLSSSKINAPRGMSVLYVNKEVTLDPIFWGGSQEKGLVSGTENVPLVLAMVDAMQKVEKFRQKHNTDYTQQKEELMKAVEGENSIQELGSENKVAAIIPLGIQGVEQETLLTALDLKGYAVGAGSSCSSGALEQNQFLQSIGLGKSFESIIRISLGVNVTTQDIEEFALTLKNTIKELKAS